MIESCDNGHSFLSSAQRRCPWCEIGRLRAELADAMAAIDRLHDQRRAVEAERDALREDAERYRWLRGDVPDHSCRWSRWELRLWDGKCWNSLQRSALDAAIDSAKEQE